MYQCLACMLYSTKWVRYGGILTFWEQVFFIQDWQQPGWCIVLQKEPRSRRVVDNDDEQILGISGELLGLQLPLDMNALEFRPNLANAGERVPAAEIARLNALVRGDRDQEDERGQARGRRGRGRGQRGRGLPRTHLN